MLAKQRFFLRNIHMKLSFIQKITATLCSVKILNLLLFTDNLIYVKFSLINLMLESFVLFLSYIKYTPNY